MLITVAEAKTHLGVSGASDDAVIEEMILAAQEAMEHFCDRSLVETDVTEHLDGNGTQRIRTREPFQSVTSIHLDGNREFDAATEVALTDVHLQTGRDGTGRVIEYLDVVWTSGQRNVKVVYQAGYTAATMPPDLTRACRMQVALLYSEWIRTKAGKDNLQSESVDGWSQRWLDKAGLDQAVKDILEPYCNWSL